MARKPRKFWPENRVANELPPAARKHEATARLVLRRKCVDLELVDELIQAAAEARERANWKPQSYERKAKLRNG
jgi:hypothetical protein